MRLIRSLMLLGMLLGGLLFTPTIALAASSSSDQACQAIQAVNPSGNCDSRQNAGASLNTVIKTILQILSWIAGVIAVIMLIVGGLKYITSQGDANSAASARNTLLYAIVGIIIVAFAQLIVKFVLTKAK